MKYVFVINPISGKRNIQDALMAQVEAYYSAQGLDYAVELTQAPGHATEIVRRYTAGGAPVRICACGGDGTLNEVAAGAVGQRNIEIGCYPCGSGNDFVKCVGRTEDFRDVSVLATGRARAVDLFKVNERYSINIVSVGIDADVSEAVMKYRRINALRGPMGYNLAVLECLFKPKGKRLRIRLDDGGEFTERVLIVVAANGNIYGGGYYAAPEAKVDDGLLDLVAVKYMSLPRILGILPKYKKGQHFAGGQIADKLTDQFLFNRGKKLEISSDQEFVVNYDGERLHAGKVSLEVLPGAIRFIVPKGDFSGSN